MITKCNNFYLSSDNIVALFLVFLRSVEKSERFSVFFGVLFVMHIMGFHDSLHVLALCLERNLDSSVHNDVMENKVENAIAQNTYTDIKQPP